MFNQHSHILLLDCYNFHSKMLPVIALPTLSQELRHAVKLPHHLANPSTVTDVTAGIRLTHEIQAAHHQSYHILTGTKC